MTESTEGQSEKTAAPGWYPDPRMADTARYWDGAAWTEHRTPEAPLRRAADSDKRVKRLALVVGLCFLVPVLGVTFIQPSVAGESCGTWIMPEFTEAGIVTRNADSMLARKGESSAKPASSGDRQRMQQPA